MKYIFVLFLIIVLLSALIDKILKIFRPNYKTDPIKLKKYLLFGIVMFTNITALNLIMGWVYKDPSYFTMSIFPFLMSLMMFIHRKKL